MQLGTHSFYLRYYRLPVLILFFILNGCINAQPIDSTVKHINSNNQITGNYRTEVYDLEIREDYRFQWYKRVYSDSLVRAIKPMEGIGSWKIINDTVHLTYDQLEIIPVFTEKIYQTNTDSSLVTVHVKTDPLEIPYKIIVTKKGILTLNKNNRVQILAYEKYYPEPSFWQQLGGESRRIFVTPGVQFGLRSIFAEFDLGLAVFDGDKGYNELKYLSLGGEYFLGANNELYGLQLTAGISMVIVAARTSLIYYTDFGFYRSMICLQPQIGFSLNTYVEVLVGGNVPLTRRNDLWPDINVVTLTLSVPLLNR